MGSAREALLAMKWLLLALGLIWASFMGFAQQAKVGARVSDFRFDAEQGGKRMRVQGDANTLGNGLWLIKTPHLETFKADGTPDAIIDAAESYFQQSGSSDLWSDKELKMRTADGRMAISGVGFYWLAAKSQLTVSNRVQTTIGRQAILEKPGATNKVKGDIQITSDSMVYSTDSVVFTGHVHVVDPQGEVNSDILNVRFDQNNNPQEIEAIDNVVLKQGETEARGKRALYNRATGLLRLFEKTKWKMGEREGESELLILDHTNNTVRAETKVKMILPASLIATNTADATNVAKGKEGNTNKVTITADAFDYAATNVVTHGAIAIYNGNVHASEPQANLDCELLTIYFGASNKLARAVADRAVKIARPDTLLEGDKAVFENDEVTVTGKPRWRQQDRRGMSETLVFNPRTKDIRATDVRLEIPNVTGTNSLLGSITRTNAPKQIATNMMVVTARFFTNVNNVATFYEHVRASDPRGQIDANQVAVYLNDTNRIERIRARGDVIMTEETMQATAQEADYDLKTETIRLTGKPKVFAEGREIIAREFLVDRKTSHFIPVAPYWAKLIRPERHSRESSSATNRTSSSK
jgi:lipopolysaccharide transport protein LptA